MSRRMSSEEINGFLVKAGEEIEKTNKFRPGMYSKYNVKRGLRNADGTGVLVGLTEIGEVHAYVIDDNEKVPVEGRLLYRGIDVFDFVEGFMSEKRFGFEECGYLLLFGTLPNAEELNTYKNVISEYRQLPEGFVRDIILKVPSVDVMNKLARSVLTYYSFDPKPDDTSLPNLLRQSIDLIAKFPLMAAYGYQAKSHYHLGNSLYIHKPNPELSTAENILSLIRPDGCFYPLEAITLDLALVLHAEHGGGNNSSFTTHVVSSSGTDTYSTIAAALGSLKGPKHGGANIKVTSMMEDLKAQVKNWSDEGQVRDYLAKIIHKEAFDRSGLIYGIGHAVYTKSDPRCVILKSKAEELAKTKGREDEFELYKLVEKLTPEVFYELKKNDKDMCANVDFYSGFVYDMLNIPMDLYTPLFATARVTGWCAHRIEEMINGGRIIRPAYKNVKGRREYVNLVDRV